MYVKKAGGENMKFGYCASMAAKDPAGIGYERIPLLQKLGFDYVEMPLTQIMSLEEQAFRSGPLAAVERCGLPCLSMNNFFPASIRLTGPDADHDGAISYAQAAFERAAKLGARTVVFGSSGARNRPCGTSVSKGMDQLASLLTRLAPLAQSHRITIVIEHLNKQESNLVNSFSDACALARRVDDTSVGALLDTFHMNLSGETYDGVLEGGALLKHVHIARTLLRSLPCPDDEEDYGLLFSTLHKIGYDGSISMEASARKDFEVEAEAALHHLRSVFIGVQGGA
jgi:sugar phosphate isomerase/epimerase